MVQRTKELEIFGMKKVVMKNEKETIILQRRAIRTKDKINKGQLIKKEDIIFLDHVQLMPYSLKLNDINKISKQEKRRYNNTEKY